MATFDLNPVADLIEANGWRQGRGSGTRRDGLTVRGAVRLEYRHRAPIVMAVLRHRGRLDEDWNDSPRGQAAVVAALRAEPIVDDAELANVFGARSSAIASLVAQAGRLTIDEMRALADALTAGGENNAQLVAEERAAEDAMVLADPDNEQRIQRVKRALGEAVEEAELDARLDREREFEGADWNVDWRPAWARATRSARRCAVSYVDPSVLTVPLRRPLREAWESVMGA